MAESLLKPITEFNPGHLASQLHDIAQDDPQLKLRGLLGVVEQFGEDYTTALKSVHEAMDQHKQGVLNFVIGVDDKVAGLASISHRSEIRRPRRSWPTAGMDHDRPRLTVDYRYAAPRIHAWTTEADGLTRVYYQLLKKTRDPGYISWAENAGLRHTARRSAAWTIESARSPDAIHRAIAVSGLERVVAKRFVDGTDADRTPPQGVLYADLVGSSRTSIGKQRELRNGAPKEPKHARTDPGVVWA